MRGKQASLVSSAPPPHQLQATSLFPLRAGLQPRWPFPRFLKTLSSSTHIPTRRSLLDWFLLTLHFSVQTSLPGRGFPWTPRPGTVALFLILILTASSLFLPRIYCNDNFGGKKKSAQCLSLRLDWTLLRANTPSSPWPHILRYVA